MMAGRSAMIGSSTFRCFYPSVRLSSRLSTMRCVSSWPPKAAAFRPTPRLSVLSSTSRVKSGYNLFTTSTSKALLPATPPTSPTPSSSPPPPPPKDLYENIYTIPNALTLARIFACPAIGYYVLEGEFKTASILLFVAGVSDLVDGYLARRFNMGTVLGSILDPAADKLLMTTMVVTLTMQDMLPLSLAILILGRDVALSISAFYFRYISLPPPKTFVRFWDFSIPSAQVNPNQLSKYNTFLQLVLVGMTTIAPITTHDLSLVLTGLQWAVAGTTIGSGLSYIRSSSAVKYIK